MTAIQPCDYGYRNQNASGIGDGMPKSPQRPICPKCGMHMTAMSEIKNGKQVVECLRCGHTETRTVSDE